jgi:hypothetical protein
VAPGNTAAQYAGRSTKRRGSSVLSEPGSETRERGPHVRTKSRRVCALLDCLGLNQRTRQVAAKSLRVEGSPSHHPGMVRDTPANLVSESRPPMLLHAAVSLFGAVGSAGPWAARAGAPTACAPGRAFLVWKSGQLNWWNWRCGGSGSSADWQRPAEEWARQVAATTAKAAKET